MTFLICQRRFQLRYLKRLPWPASPADERTETALLRGQQFHQLLERHFLGLPIEESLIDPHLRRWWSLFQSSRLPMPPGRLLPELSLTVPVGRHLLTGRFDLLVVAEENGAPLAHVFDWKTSRPRDAAALQQEWQTRLYLAMLAEGGGAVWGHNNRPTPDHLALTYWYVGEPAAPRTIHYSQAQHTQNWAEIQALVAQIEAQLALGHWPLTEDWSSCRECAYQVFCDRQAAGQQPAAGDQLAADDELEPSDDEWLLEPDLP
jgi:hypothetical protein